MQADAPIRGVAEGMSESRQVSFRRQSCPVTIKAHVSPISYGSPLLGDPQVLQAVSLIRHPNPSMDLTILSAVLVFPILPYCWNLIRHSLCGQDDSYSSRKSATPTSLKRKIDEAYHERREQPLTCGYDDQASGQRMGFPQWQDAAIDDGEGPGNIPASAARLREEGSLTQPDAEWAHASHTGGQDSGSREEHRRKAAEFWTWSPERQSWYHKGDLTGEEIWAPFELD